MNALAPIVLVLLLAAEPPSAPPVSSAQPAHHPHWVRQPSGVDLANTYPESARSRGTAGRSVMECTIRVDGMLDTCVVLSEDPPGMGFGAAELRLKSKFKFADEGGITPGVKIKIPVAWRVG